MTGRKLNAAIVLLVNSKEIQVGHALVGQTESNAFSSVEFFHDGGYDVQDGRVRIITTASIALHQTCRISLCS